MNKTIWITGASRGIGEALALQYNEAGYFVILSSRKEEDLIAVQQRLKHPELSMITPLDLSDHASIPDIVKEVTKDHEIDVIIHNGGISQRSLAIDSDFTVYKQMIDVNYLGTVALNQSLLDHLMERPKAQIAVISSVAGKFGVPMRSGYSGSKFALHGYFEALRAELSDTKVGITLVCPGFIQTNLSLYALTGDGSPQKKMDQAQKKGMDVDLFARKCKKAIDQEKPEVYIGGFRETTYAIWVWRFFPNIFRKVIARSKVT